MMLNDTYLFFGPPIYSQLTTNATLTKLKRCYLLKSKFDKTQTYRSTAPQRHQCFRRGYTPTLYGNLKYLMKDKGFRKQTLNGSLFPLELSGQEV